MESARCHVVSTDLVYRGCGVGRRDFLREPACGCRSVITNPPFALAEQFVLHALELGHQKIAALLRTAFLEGQARHASLWKPYPPVRVWQFCARQTLWRCDDPNPRTGGGTMAFAWLVWEFGYGGAPALGWLPGASK